MGLQPQVSCFSFLCLNFFFGQKELFIFTFTGEPWGLVGEASAGHRQSCHRSLQPASTSHQHGGAQGPVRFLCILTGKRAFYNNYAVSLLKAEAIPFPPSSQRDRVLADLPILQSRVRNFAGRGVPDFTASCPWELPYHKGMSCTGCKSLVTAITGS